MTFCANCGAPVEGRFCAKCGTAVGSAPTGTPSGPPPGGAQQYSAPATSGGLTENVAGALCYLLGLITGILFLVLAPYNQSKFVRFHAFQAIFFHVSWIGLWIVETIIAVVMPWQLHMLLSLFTILLSLGGLAVWLFLMYKAYNNEKFKLPIIGDLAEKQS
jgi:uncharacterized membrane protein